jgi:hypothetical protein
MPGFYEQFLRPGHSWNQGADEAYNQQQTMDETGALGIQGSVPAGVALNWQDRHNQTVWNFQQRLLGASTGYLRGALGDLQRFRPGGAAALQSGVYGQLSQNLMNRAQLTQPMDLLGDYRRHEAHQARKAAKKAAMFALGGQLAGAAIGAAAGGPAGAQMGAQQGAAIGTMASGEAGYAASGQPPPSGQPGGMGGPGAVGGGVGGQVGMQAGMQQNGVQPPPGTGQATIAPPGQAPGAPGGAPGGIPAPGPGATPAGPGGGEDQQGGGPQARQAMGGGGTMGFGSNGDFSPLTLATMAAGEAYPEQPMVKLALQEYLVESVERDPDWQALGAAVRNEALARGLVA